MGIPPPKRGEEDSAKAGATFVPNQFKNNVELSTYLNEISVSLIKKPIIRSESI